MYVYNPRARPRRKFRQLRNYQCDPSLEMRPRDVVSSEGSHLFDGCRRLEDLMKAIDGKRDMSLHARNLAGGL